MNLSSIFNHLKSELHANDTISEENLETVEELIDKVQSQADATPNSYEESTEDTQPPEVIEMPEWVVTLIRSLTQWKFCVNLQAKFIEMKPVTDLYEIEKVEIDYHTNPIVITLHRVLDKKVVKETITSTTTSRISGIVVNML